MSRVDQTLKFTMPASLTALSLQSYEFVTIEEPFYTVLIILCHISLNYSIFIIFQGFNIVYKISHYFSI